VARSQSNRTRQELEDVERRRARALQEREQADAARRKMLSEEKNVLGVVDRLDRQIERTRRTISRINAEIAALDRSIADLEQEIAVLSGKVNARRRLVADRLRTYYKINYSSPHGVFALTLRADNLSDFLSRLEYASRIRRRDDAVISAYQTDQALLTKRKADLEEQEAERVRQQRALTQQEQNLSGERRERQATLLAIRRDRGLKERAIREMDASLRQLNALIRQLEARARAEEGRGKTGDEAADGPGSTVQVLGSTEEVALAIKTFGRVDWPVEGRILSNASGALEGVTIRADEGTPVSVILDGAVEYAKWFNGPGFGKLIVVNHGKGYRSFYAHLQDFNVSEGDRLRKGEILGTVGTTGSLVGPVLYFEMRHHFHVLDFRRVAR
jgi:septal ring factor EnvC (AmiA/AmiB activator)